MHTSKYDTSLYLHTMKEDIFLDHVIISDLYDHYKEFIITGFPNYTMHGNKNKHLIKW